MSPKTIRRIHTVYAVALAVLVVAVGVGFALACLSIYRSGDSPYTAESISAHFAYLAPLVYATLVGVVGGIVLAWTLPRRDLVVPGSEDDPLDVIVARYRRGLYRPVKDPAVTLKRLLARVDEGALSPENREAVVKERRLRRSVCLVAAMLTVGLMLPAVAWCVNPAHFSVEHLNDDIKTAALLVVPCAVTALGVLVASTLLRLASIKRETTVVVSAMLPKTSVKRDAAQAKASMAQRKGLPFLGKKGGTDEVDPRFKRRLRLSVRVTVLMLGILFVVLGVINGGMDDVLGKAVRICTECIGLG